jgi:hypothetical protein
MKFGNTWAMVGSLPSSQPPLSVVAQIADRLGPRIESRFRFAGRNPADIDPSFKPELTGSVVLINRAEGQQRARGRAGGSVTRNLSSAPRWLA